MKKALAEALENNEIAGAGLDVFESEPLAKESPLLQINDASKTFDDTSYCMGNSRSKKSFV